MQEKHKIRSAFFITFNGNCRKALTLYQNCFGGTIYFNIFDGPIPGVEEPPVVSGVLTSEKVTVFGSDLVPNEGRRVGNYISIYIHCDDCNERLIYLKKLNENLQECSPLKYVEQKLIEVTDPFDVRWVFGI